MKTPDIPVAERARLALLNGYDVLDTLPEQSLDDLAALAAHICGAPVAMISLVDENRQWFKARYGDVPMTETTRDISFCGHAILQHDVFIVPDAMTDDRFHDNPLVTGAPRIRFYAGAPLLADDGHALGALCVIDHVARELTTSQREGLAVLSRQVMSQLELRRRTAAVRQSEARLRLVTNNARVGLVLLDRDRRYVYANDAYGEILGLPERNIVGLHVREVLPTIYEEQIAPRLTQAFAGERVAYELQRPNGAGTAWYSVRYEPEMRNGVAESIVVVITEITERKESEIALQRASVQTAEAAREFRGLFALNPLTMWIYDCETLRFLEVNDAAVGRYGYSREEFLAMSILDIRSPEEAERLGRYVSQPRGTWRDAGTWRHKLKSGKLVDVEISSHNITFEGRPGMLVVATDVTERMQAREAQRRSDLRYHTLFDTAPDGIIVADVAGHFVDANASICRMLGYTRDELLAVPVAELLIPEERPLLEAAGHEVTTQSVRTREWHYQRKDGSVLSVETSSLRLGDGNVLAIVRDVTERKEAAEALRVAEERMRFALESAGIGIWERDFRTDTLHWSAILEAHHGLVPGTFAGTVAALIERMHPDDVQETGDVFRKAVKNGGEFTMAYRTIRPDGKTRWLRGAGRIVLDGSGNPVRGVGVMMDITDQRMLEMQFQQAQKMEAIGRLAGGVAHDFNNTLTAILGYCEILLADADPQGRTHADLTEIRKAGVSAGALTRQLLAFSRKEIVPPSRLDLNEVIGDLHPMLERLIGEDVRIELRLQPALDRVMVARGQVDQILMNLAVNARDAMPNGGSLRIETRNVELDEHYPTRHFGVKAGQYVLVAVTDTGTGMSAEVQDRLFEPFFTTKEPGKGTGLGLANIHGIVQGVGGTINVYSEVGLGTTFNVYFPRVDTPVAAALPAAAALRPSARGSETVLVVDDLEALRALSKRMLERLGYTVLTAASAAEAHAILAGSVGIDVLLTDVVMPGASGPELKTQLSAIQPGLRVIYMSGYTEDRIEQHGVLEPGVAFLHKPFTSAILAQRLREVLDETL